MSHWILYLALVSLIILSAFFSGSETAMMSINRYRLRHMMRKGNQSAKRVAKLLERPDRLLGVILLGNTFANILASAVATTLAVRYFGDLGILLATIVLTAVILIFAETAPKTLAALHPERVSFPASFALNILLKLAYPIVWIINGIANNILKLFGIHVRSHKLEPLSAEELRTIVFEAKGKISPAYQQMLLGILDLEKVTVVDVMVPRNKVHGIDLDDDMGDILHQLGQCEHAQVPLYRENIDNVVGILKLRKVLEHKHWENITKQDLLRMADKVYFVPEAALLNRQLLNFQEQQKSLGLVVDEYGDIQGLVTLQDILEEIVGAFAHGLDEGSRYLKKQKDGSVLVDGRITIRDLNRITGWQLPLDGPKTLSGLLIEHLESIPPQGIGVRIGGYPMEILQVSENMVKLVRILPKLYQK